jgi:hypothetical protein
MTLAEWCIQVLAQEPLGPRLSQANGGLVTLMDSWWGEEPGGRRADWQYGTWQHR